MIQTAGDSKLPELEDGVTATVNFRGRFMVPSGKEYQCSITEMSTREVFLSSCEKPEVGQKIIVYAHEVGRFVGIVERHQDSSFSARLDLANVKKTRIAQRLARHVANRRDGGIERPKHSCIVPMRQVTLIRLPSGSEHYGRINNISTEGVEFVANLNVGLDANITIDSRPAKIKHPLEGGFYAEFTDGEALSCRGFGVAFGAKVVLADVTLSLPSRGVTVLMGPSGTGKSTLLRSLAAIFVKNEIFGYWGDALYLGAPIAPKHAPAFVKQRIEMMQRSSLESLLYHLADENVSSEKQRAKIVAWLEVIEAKDIIQHLDQSFLDLDTVTQRKIAILREAASMPALLMIDEPTSGLNDQDASQILQLIEHVGRHMAVLLVLHNQKQARTIGQSVILLAGGRVQEHSATEHFFESQNAITRKFIETGSCAVPAPDARPETLSEDAPPPPPLPEAAVRSVENREVEAAKTDGATAPTVVSVIEPPAPEKPKPVLRWLDALPPKAPLDGPGTEGFYWVVEGRLAGAPRPGAVHDFGYELDLIKSAGVTTLITLTEANLPQSMLRLRSLENVHLPIPDGKAPTIERSLALLDRMQKLMESGRVLLVHCLQGVGRTGTILAACLIQGKGLSASEAISQLRKVNPEFVKTEEQEAFLTVFQKAVQMREAELPKSR